MDFNMLLIYLSSALLVGLGGWFFRHTIDRRLHPTGGTAVSDELLTARLQALEDRIGGRIAAVNVKLEDLEKWTQDINRRLEDLSRG